MVGNIEVEMGSNNVFADLALPDAEKLKIKSGLVVEIIRAMRRLHLTQKTAARQMSIPQPKVSAMRNGDFSNLSERKLMDCLNRLGGRHRDQAQAEHRTRGPPHPGIRLK
jgi:predicted XRE-type DNA-binding protein